LLSTAVLLVLRAGFHRVPLLANPFSVIVIEAAIFLLLASAVRALRRLLILESLFSTGNGARLLLVGNDNALSAALHLVLQHRNLEVIGLLVPGCKEDLRGLQISGCPVLGDPSVLSQLLDKHKVDLVMITDASMDCIADVVSVATQHGVEVRLLPSAANVIRDEVRFSTPRHVSSRLERILVLGGAGYVGSTLVPMLLAQGYKVRVLDRLLFGSESLNAVCNNSNFELVEGDVRDIQAVVRAVQDQDAVIDLAAIVGDPACAINKELSFEVNRAATRMLTEVCKGYGVSRFVFASTCSVYGASDYLVDELTNPAPISTYAETKVSSEQLLLEAASANFHPVILRLGTLFGLSPRPRFDLVVNLLAARAAAGGKITVFNGEQWRPFLHVHDASRAFATTLQAKTEVVSAEIFNVGDYRLNLRLSEVSCKIAELVPVVEVEHLENGDKRNYRVSFDKIHTELGFVCDKMIEFGIREIVEAIGSRQITDFTASRFNNQHVTQIFVDSSSAEQSSIRVLSKLAA
jgi:nucleoside-diphosphate-sugar epimerase